MWGISYWVFPLFSAAVWIAMLLAMLLTWVTGREPIYPSMEAGQTIAYISDVGAQRLKPLFIAGSAVTVVSLDLAFILERWLRHNGRLAKNTSRTQKALSILSVIFAIVGAAGLILLACFDTLRYPRLHDGFLIMFIAGYVVSAIFICAQYQRLGIHYRQHRVLRASFWIKLVFILVEVALAIAFGVTQYKHIRNTSAVLEWVIALVFTFYVLSFFVDFIPAVHTKHHTSRQTAAEVEMGMDGSAGGQIQSEYYSNGQPATSTDSRYGLTTESAHGYSISNLNAMGYASQPTDGHVGSHLEPNAGIHGNTYYPDGRPSRPVAASQNF
ncbi:Frag1/DRAM/Sfk1 family-domain-containing protein [Cryomyces antarcticus]